MSKKQIIRNLDDLMRALEVLRSHIMDLEAMAHAAAEALEHLPYLPRLPHPPHTKHHAAGTTVPKLTEETRRNMGRMQSMVVATAAAATQLLEEIEAIVDQVEIPRPDDSSNSNNNDDDASDTGAHAPRMRYSNRYTYLPNGGASVIRAHSPTYRLPSDAARKNKKILAS